jgi:hypothetical protein
VIWRCRTLAYIGRRLKAKFRWTGPKKSRRAAPTLLKQERLCKQGLEQAVLLVSLNPVRGIMMRRRELEKGKLMQGHLGNFGVRKFGMFFWIQKTRCTFFECKKFDVHFLDVRILNTENLMCIF